MSQAATRVKTDDHRLCALVYPSIVRTKVFWHVPPQSLGSMELGEIMAAQSSVSQPFLVSAAPRESMPRSPLAMANTPGL